MRKTIFFLAVFAISIGCSQNTANFRIIQEHWTINNSWKSTQKKCLLQDVEFREKDSYWLKKKYKKNIYLQPRNAESYFLYGRLLGLLKKPNAAINYFHQALNYDSEYLWALYSIGILHLKEDARLQAQIFLQRCVDLNFQFTPGLVALAKLKINNNKQQALYLLFCAETFSPKNADIKQHIANVFVLTEQYDKALAKYKEIERISPNNAAVLNEWGKLLVKLKKYKAALLVMNKLNELLPENKKFAMEKTISLIKHLMKKNRGIE
ncbi:tetratricopeptide repeat protein [Candidatus Uabimicrobium amorphum]|uniref:Tetratricopeptide repeat protein n=1 Tax=Uabimicrobium amorphum TaxID=2596890 RepID=A0A5S9F5B9_UABAM|nr:hypothetical protein [Candidatus Uabimicrobium amorphum]BBM86438.1 hypothetical protein UABAM_04824 [Candidatus Uabimicrobium amorphum]